ncbi:putative sterigmatocystin biosynthesis peroxidase stcC [Grifola frondosa]|uniref:Putative sterigmatocystin biosynthesis peroxidase stcC n=1 Tax=Grifola frondosa TaxID=5627 RepID=A0A1C7MMT9_GRIFR|nr:putative sterigmatocystin biosynthesis peroxidase stcC [Grifola frondosa]
MANSFVVIAFKRIVQETISAVSLVLVVIGLAIWDVALTLVNLVLPKKPANKVVPPGHAGAGGLWPQYVPPAEGDSRCACPMLNALANHGILPHSGRGITFRELGTAIRATYNVSPVFGFFGPAQAANFLNRSYWTDTLDLSDLDVHNCIEHDASFTRDDQHVAGDQDKPLSFALKLFGSSNSALMLTVWGGVVKDLRSVLLEERIPDGWQPRVRRPMGLTVSEIQWTVLAVELGVKEEVDGEFSGAGASASQANCVFVTRGWLTKWRSFGTYAWTLLGRGSMNPNRSIYQDDSTVKAVKGMAS